MSNQDSSTPAAVQQTNGLAFISLEQRASVVVDWRAHPDVVRALERAAARTTAQREQAATRAAARAKLLMAWRAHPEVIADCARWECGAETWGELCTEARTDDLAWGLPDQTFRLGSAASIGVGFAELSEAERQTIRDEHAKGGTRHALDPTCARWLLVEDRNETGPADLPPVDAAAWHGVANAWASAYRARLPHELRHLGMLVLPEPGKAIVLAVWVGTERAAATLRSWARAIGGGADVRDDDGNLVNPGRFRVLRDASACASTFVALEPAAAVAASLLDLVAPPIKSDASGAVLRTGIGPLDALLVTGGVPRRGARVVVQAPTANAKSALNLQIAEFLAAAGLSIGWIATRDETAESIRARRLQRAGHARADAIRLANDPAALAELNPNLAVIDGREWLLEDVLTAGGSGPDVLFLDPLQKVRSRAGEGRGQVESIAAALDVIETSGVTTFMTSAMVRGAGRRSKIEGSYGGAAIENGATLLLDLALTDDALRVAVLKSRYGGEGESFVMTLDRASQTLTAACGDALAEAIRKVLVDRGSLTQAQLLVRVTGGQNAIAEALKAGVAAGLWRLDGRHYHAC
jgi:hypothetical protein